MVNLFIGAGTLLFLDFEIFETPVHDQVHKTTERAAALSYVVSLSFNVVIFSILGYMVIKFRQLVSTPRCYLAFAVVFSLLKLLVILIEVVSFLVVISTYHPEWYKFVLHFLSGLVGCISIAVIVGSYGFSYGQGEKQFGNVDMLD